jgi:hypothetical protein
MALCCESCGFVAIFLVPDEFEGIEFKDECPTCGFERLARMKKLSVGEYDLHEILSFEVEEE